MRRATRGEQEEYLATLVRVVRAAWLLAAMTAALLVVAALAWCIGWLASR